MVAGGARTTIISFYLTLTSFLALEISDLTLANLKPPKSFNLL